MEKSCRKCAPKVSPRPLFNFGKRNRTAITCRKVFLKKDVLKVDYQKTSRKLTLYFLLNAVPFNGQDYKKQKGPGTSDQLFFRLQSIFRKTNLSVMYYLAQFDDVI